MTIPDRFGPIRSRWPLAKAIEADLTAWMPEYLAAFERQNPEDLEPGQTPAPRSLQARHAPFIRKEEQTPAIVVYLSGVTDHYADADDTLYGSVEVGILVVAASNQIDATGDLLHRYVAAVTGLLTDFPTAGGLATGLELVDEDYTPIEPQKERTLLGVDLSYLALGFELGRRGQGPPPNAVPRPDPTAPWPLEQFETTSFDGITPTRLVDPIDPED